MCIFFIFPPTKQLTFYGILQLRKHGTWKLERSAASLIPKSSVVFLEKVVSHIDTFHSKAYL